MSKQTNFVLQFSHDSLRAKWSKGLSVAYHLCSDFDVDLFFSKEKGILFPAT
jgi:hypothetical protein